MKKIFVTPKGQIILKEVNKPIMKTKGSLVKTSYALISSGTELFIINSVKFQNLSLLKKLIKSKELRKKALKIIKDTSLKKAYYFFIEYSGRIESKKKFSSPSSRLTPIGYSCSGIIQESNIKQFYEFDRVACAGSNHAEEIFSPKNLTCKIPDNISFEEAAFVTLGSIALHGIHRANICPGENVGIIGVGLIGLLTLQLAKISGARVFAFDLINKRLNLAKELGSDYIFNPIYFNPKEKVIEKTGGKGLDSIIICAHSKTPQPLEDAIELIRQNGKIVLLGAFPIQIDRTKLYYKEADLLISRSYGPGRYDPYYEFEGYDYTKKFVPWTEKRNMKLFLKLISEKKLNVKSLISDIIPAADAKIAYEKLENDPINNIAILLKFSQEENQLDLIPREKEADRIQKKLVIGLIGCGTFAQTIHIPLLISNPKCKIRAICTKSKTTAEFCSKKYRPDYVTTKYNKLLKDPEIDTIFIYTQHDTHAKISIEALKSNKNVYVEKPMGITLKECLDVYNAVKTSQKQYTIGFNRRYSPFIKIAKDLLKNRNNPIIINYRIANTFLSGAHWTFDPEVGGGPIIGEFCHFIDLILYLMNSEPIELTARGGSLSHKDSEVYDNCVVIIKFKNNSIANLIYTDLNGPNMSKERIEIYCGDSSIIIDDFIELKTSGFDFGNMILNQQDKGHNREIEAVINANLGKEELLLDINDAIKAMDLVFKTIDSIRLNNSIEINRVFDEQI